MGLFQVRMEALQTRNCSRIKDDNIEVEPLVQLAMRGLTKSRKDWKVGDIYCARRGDHNVGSKLEKREKYRASHCDKTSHSNNLQDSERGNAENVAIARRLLEITAAAT